MKTIRTDDFDRILEKLPKPIQRLLEIQLDRFAENTRDPRLHIKKVKTLEYGLSLRITRRYRAFFYFQNPETAIFFDIDHRKDAYR